MPYEIIEKCTTEFLELAVVGTESLEDNKQLVTHILSACADHGLRRVLVDTTALSEPVGAPRDFDLAQHLRDAGVSTAIDRFACLHDVRRRAVAHPFEMACQNRGGNVRAFESRAGAVEVAHQ